MTGSFSKAITAAATPEALSATTLRVNWATIQAKAANTSSVVVGTEATVASGITVAKGESITLWSTASLNLAIDLAQIFVKAGTNGDGVDVLYVA